MFAISDRVEITVIFNGVCIFFCAIQIPGGIYRCSGCGECRRCPGSGLRALPGLHRHHPSHHRDPGGGPAESRPPVHGGDLL